jgi:AcrR family transcriptional regulator
MPFPRFSKLPLEKRERLMEAAAQEFAAYGFDDASLNRILETVQMSKGAAYYYFEDKVDLFFTVIHYCNERLKLFDLELDPATLTAENFWRTFAELHRQPRLALIRAALALRSGQSRGAPVSRSSSARTTCHLCQAGQDLDYEHGEARTGVGRHPHRYVGASHFRLASGSR